MMIQKIDPNWRIKNPNYHSFSKTTTNNKFKKIKIK